jgi:molybdopterin converting factor small subunit
MTDDVRTVPVTLFGPLTDHAVPPVAVDVAFPVSIAVLRQRILDAYPAFATVSFRIAVDGRIQTEENVVEAASEIALLPPFAGG